MTAEDRDLLLRRLGEVERDTGKNNVKWIKAPYPRRLAYIRRALAEMGSETQVFVALYRDRSDYVSLTVQTIARALMTPVGSGAEATIFIDALPRRSEREIGLTLRRMGLPVKKVRGIRRDESDALIRLADAVCGLTRAAEECQPEMKIIFKNAITMKQLRALR